MTRYARATQAAMVLMLLAWQPACEAAVYRCEMGGKTAYQSEPCSGGRSLPVRAKASTATPTESASTPAAATQAPDKEKVRCQGEELNLNFRNTPLPMVLQVIADFSGRKAQVDPAVTGNQAIQYPCTPWRTILQDIAQRHQLSIQVSDRMIVVQKR